jgi:hypothetical protein
MANGYAFALQAQAAACATPVDAANSYPKAGTNTGGGRHITPLFVTQTYAVPALISAQWWYPADATTTVILTPLAVSLGLPAPAPIPVTIIIDAAIAVPA